MGTLRMSRAIFSDKTSIRNFDDCLTTLFDFVFIVNVTCYLSFDLLVFYLFNIKDGIYKLLKLWNIQKTHV